MATYIEMPKLADTMTEGTLVKWRKGEGDKVEAGDVVAEVETDKATMEMEAFDNGVLHKYLVQVGQKVPIGARLALVLKDGEKPPVGGEEPSAPGVAEKAEAHPDSAGVAKGEKGEEKAPAPRAASAPVAKAAVPATGGRIRSSPLARKLAQAQGVDLATLHGSGPGGRIVARDISAPTNGHSATAPAAPRTGSAPLASAPAAATVPSMPAGPNDKVIPLSGMRRTIAERLLVSKTQLPHFYLHIEVDAGPMMALRAEVNAASEASGGPKLTVNDFVLKAVIAAAVKVPAVNASFAGDSIIQYASVNLAVAVAVEEGLVTPVIRDAQSRSMRQISEAVKDLATRARSKKLKPDEYQGGTLTVSNLGSYGIDFFDAIINPPQAMIVSVGAIVKKPVVGPKDQIVAGQRLALGLSADHRVVDGAIGAQYLAELRRLVENPALMLV